MTQPQRRPLVIRVAPSTIRQKFNRCQYPKFIQQGSLVRKYLRNKHLDRPHNVGEPWCTNSQVIRYSNSSGKLLVVVHQYFRPDNSIGGKGRPDPKRLWLRNRIYVADKTVSRTLKKRKKKEGGSI